MRKAINALGWLGVTVTMLAMILTMVSTYHFTYIKFFSNYYALQWCLFFTMLIWGVKMFNIKSGFRDMIYTVVFFLMAFGSMFFRYMRVF